LFPVTVIPPEPPAILKADDKKLVDKVVADFIETSGSSCIPPELLSMLADGSGTKRHHREDMEVDTEEPVRNMKRSNEM
jgi:hypothetical protein